MEPRWPRWLRRWFASAMHRGIRNWGTGFWIPPLPRAEFGRLAAPISRWSDIIGLSLRGREDSATYKSASADRREEPAWRRLWFYWGRQGRGVCRGSNSMGGNWRHVGVIGYQIGRKRDKIRNKLFKKIFFYESNFYSQLLSTERPTTHRAYIGTTEYGAANVTDCVTKRIN